MNFTSLLARGRDRFTKIIKNNVLVARGWGTSAKRKCPGLGKYAHRFQDCLLNTVNLSSNLLNLRVFHSRHSKKYNTILCDFASFRGNSREIRHISNL